MKVDISYPKDKLPRVRLFVANAPTVSMTPEEAEALATRLINAAAEARRDAR